VGSGDEWSTEQQAYMGQENSYLERIGSIGRKSFGLGLY